jgi:Transglycosylase SLT domain
MGCFRRLFWFLVVLIALALALAISVPGFGQLVQSSASSAVSRLPAVVSSVVVTSVPPCSGTGYVKLACQDAQAEGIPSDLFIKQINQESGFQPAALGTSGEIGIAQFMPDTAAGLGLNPHDPVASLKTAAHLMASYQRSFGNYAMALAAYNAGSARVSAAVANHGASWGAYIPVSTRSYVCTIMGELCS